MLTAGAHIITVRATDGQGATGQDSVCITVQPGTGLPTVQILEPGPDLAVTPGTTIPLRGVATDPEDGSLTGSRLVWSSDRDGILGTGQSINVVLSGPAVTSAPRSAIVPLSASTTRRTVASTSTACIRYSTRPARERRSSASMMSESRETAVWM